MITSIKMLIKTLWFDSIYDAGNHVAITVKPASHSHFCSNIFLQSLAQWIEYSATNRII